MSVFTRNFLDLNNAERPQGVLGQANTLDVENIRNRYGTETAGMTDQQVESWYRDTAKQSNIDRNTLSVDDINANLTNERRADWNRRFRQFEDMSVANVMDPTRLGELRGQAFDITNDSVNNALERRDNRMQTYLSRMGQRQSSAESRGTQRQNAVQKNALMSQARTSTRGYLNQRENGLLGTGTLT